MYYTTTLVDLFPFDRSTCVRPGRLPSETSFPTRVRRTYMHLFLNDPRCHAHLIYPRIHHLNSRNLASVVWCVWVCACNVPNLVSILYYRVYRIGNNLFLREKSVDTRTFDHVTIHMWVVSCKDAFGAHAHAIDTL